MQKLLTGYSKYVHYKSYKMMQLMMSSKSYGPTVSIDICILRSITRTKAPFGLNLLGRWGDLNIIGQ